MIQHERAVNFDFHTDDDCVGDGAAAQDLVGEVARREEHVAAEAGEQRVQHADAAHDDEFGDEA